MVSWIQNLPGQIDLIVFSVGSISIRWYSLMYLVGFLVVFFLLKVKIQKKSFQEIKTYRLLRFQLLDFMFFSIIGVMVGGRLGYVFFYNLLYYLKNPLEIFFPIQLTDYGYYFVGYYGMSFYGGVIGVMIAWFIFSKRKGVSFWELADFVVPAIPAGYFFGRIGNFLNGELYGRITDKFWGMNFGDGFLRHPSQIYEAILEGALLFAILWWVQEKWKIGSGKLSAVFIGGYAFFRFFVEFFREPDEHLGLICWNLTLGHLISFVAIIFAILIFLLKNKKYDNLK